MKHNTGLNVASLGAAVDGIRKTVLRRPLAAAAIGFGLAMVLGKAATARPTVRK